VRAAPRNNAVVIDTLGLALVRVLGYLAKDHEPDTLRAAWARVATPAGTIGLVAPGTLMSLTPERLCYGKDGFGRRRIAGAHCRIMSAEKNKATPRTCRNLDVSDLCLCPG
jgi:hypothetical protein